ncbi:hypothetical protein HY991_03370 [Candidatus Micrarchaeota archaeon]|nr:hypothetical protein [Candidatus Micrarchaeota archaeon]
MKQRTNVCLSLMLLLLLLIVYILVFKPAEITGRTPGVNVTTVNVSINITIPNKSPIVTVVNVEPNVAPCAMGSSCAVGDRQQIWVNATVVDENGYSDINNVNATIWRFVDGPSDDTNAANDSKRYFNTSCLKTQINATTAWYNCTVYLKWFAMLSVTGWRASVTANDSSQQTGTSATASFGMDPCVGIATDPVNGGTIAFGNVNPGYTSNQTFNVTNRCNDQLDLKLQGMQFCTGGCSNRILLGTGTSNVNVTFAYSKAATAIGNGLNTTGYFNASENMPSQVVQADTGCCNRTIYLELFVPMGQRGGAYTGYLNITAQSG